MSEDTPKEVHFTRLEAPVECKHSIVFSKRALLAPFHIPTDPV